jgi:hypothetical protein
MPANTALGYPYPLGTDRVADGDDAIRSLAEAVDDHAGVFASGIVTVVNVTPNTPTTATVTFPVGRFTAQPVICLTANGGSTSAYASASHSASAVGPTGFQVNTYRPVGTGNLNVGWIAHQI